MLRTIQGIDVGSPELRPEDLQDLGMSKQFILDLFGQTREFPLERRIE